MLMSMGMSLSLLSGCGTSSTTSGTTAESSSDSGTIYGEVSKVSKTGITIEVGTKNEPSDKKESSSDSSSSKSDTTTSSSSSSNSSDNKQDGQGKAHSIIEKTGEEKTIAVDSDTEVTKESMPSGGPGQGGEAPSEQPPEKPSGNSNSNSSSSENSNSDSKEQPPEKPDGNSSSNSSSSDSSSSDSKEQSSEKTSEKPESEEEEIELSDVSKGDIVSVTYGDDGSVEKITIIMSAQGGGQGGNGGSAGGQQSQKPDSYEAVKEYTTDTTKKDQKVSSTGTDENAIHAYNNANVNLSGYTITRNSSSSQGGDNSSFYGVGAAVLESAGKLLVSDTTITTNAKGAAGIFSYANGTVYTANTKIKTTKDTSGGIHVAGGGKLYAWDMDVETSGESSAAIRSDRGGGTMVVNGGTYTSNGKGSPAVYSTADIAINNADLTANGSEAVCIEGLNSIHMYHSDVTGNMSDDSQNDCTWNVILYQSMSGDSEVGNSTYEMNGGTLTAKNGGMFYTTNTESTITLSDVDITYAKDNDFFLKCTGNSNKRGWGTSGKNGADCLFTAIDQDMEGDVIWDSISDLDFYMTDGSTLKGAIKDDESNAGDGGDGYCNVYIEKGSTWTVTGNSTVTNLQNAGKIVDKDGNTVTIVGTDGTVYVKGSSKYKVTVTSYKKTADVSGASKTTSWSKYKVEKPSNL